MSETSLDISTRIDLIQESLGLGIWDWNIQTGEEYWSDSFFKLLGYKPGETASTFDNWINNIVEPGFKSQVELAIKQHLESGFPYRLQIRMKHRYKGFLWYETTGQAERNSLGVAIRMAGSIRNIQNEKAELDRLSLQRVLLQEGSEMAKVGAWSVDLVKMKQQWSDEIFRIHDMPIGQPPSVEEGIKGYAPEHVPLISDAFNSCVTEKKPYDLELQIISGKGVRKWVRALGKPEMNSEGEVTRVFGVFQDIDTRKRQSLELESSHKKISGQNARLMNFAHIVSHNLRSHVGNLELMLSMLDEEISAEEKEQFLIQVKGISAALNETIQHLNDVVSIQTTNYSNLQTVNIEEAIDMAVSIVQPELDRIGGKINISLEWHAIDYMRAYMDSILINLLSNAIRYHEPNRKLEIGILSYYEGNEKCLEVRDNGLGMDLDRVDKKLFGMYKTFHEHPDSRGIGLFMTKNQIESLGGSISVESQVGQGSVFRINFENG